MDVNISNTHYFVKYIGFWKVLLLWEPDKRKSRAVTFLLLSLIHVLYFKLDNQYIFLIM